MTPTRESVVRMLFVLAVAMPAGFSPPLSAHEALGHDSAVSGAGTSLGHPIISRWAQGYRRAAGGGTGITAAGAGLDDPPTRPPLAYEPVGSLAGIMRVKGGAVDFGATDMPLQSDELARLGLIQFPIVVGGVVAVVNIDDVPPGAMKLTGPLLADIFLGRVRAWSDPAIRALNPDLRLPEAPIQVIYRADGSGTAFNFTDFLSRSSAEWKAGAGSGLAVSWPVGTGVRSNDRMSQAVRRTKNSIGYIDFAHAMQARLSYAAIRNQAGRFVLPDSRAFQAAASTAAWSAGNDFALLLTDAPGEQAYPLATTVFVLMPRNAAASHTGKTLQFFQWALERGERDATALGYVPLPPGLVSQIKDYWKQSLVNR